MKRFCIISVFIAITSVNAVSQNGWNIQSVPYSSGLSGLYALDSLNVWAAGQNGLIVHSMDGGVTWDSVPNGASVILNTVEFINADTGFVAGRDNETGTPWLNHLLQRTTDGGLNWEFINLPGGQQNTIFDLDFVEGPPGEAMRGYCVGGLANVWVSNDYGETWDRANGSCGEGNFNSCFFADSLTGWFVGTPSNVIPYTIMYTADGGESFVEQTSPEDIKLNGVCFGNESQGVAVGNAGVIIYTSDGGENWEKSTDEDIAWITWFSVFVSESGKAWAVGNHGNIVYSEDWGQTWEKQESGVSDPLWEVYFVNDSIGWVSGGLTRAVILRTKDGGGVTPGTGISEEDSPYRNQLEQNYPNPFSTSTQISYALKNSSHNTLTVYDISGRKVQTLVDEFQAAGEHSIHWDASHFSSGLYFYELKVDHVSIGVKKMMRE